MIQQKETASPHMTIEILVAPHIALLPFTLTHEKGAAYQLHQA